MHRLSYYLLIAACLPLTLVETAHSQGRGGRSPAQNKESKVPFYQIPGLPSLSEEDCENVFKRIQIPVTGNARLKFEIYATKMVALHNMLVRLTKNRQPISYNASKNELSVQIPKEFGKAETIKLPLYPAGQGPQNIRTFTQLSAQAERLIVAALFEKSPQRGVLRLRSKIRKTVTA